METSILDIFGKEKKKDAELSKKLSAMFTKVIFNFQLDFFPKFPGDWFQNEKHGTGTYNMKSGNIYVGEFRKGKAEGIFNLNFQLEIQLEIFNLKIRTWSVSLWKRWNVHRKLEERSF